MPPMAHKIENIMTELWHQIIEDLKRSGFEEVYRYGGMDAGIDYNRYDLVKGADGESITFEWDNWMEGEVEAPLPRLQALRARYNLSDPLED